MSEATESIEAYVLEVVRQTGAVPSVEFVQFSGSSDDVILQDNACFLRVAATQRLDGDGNPYTLTVRLSAPGGLWVIPTVATEMLALIPATLGDVPGVGWVVSGAQTPPAKLDQDKAFLTVSAKLAASLTGLLLKTAGVTLGLDDGKFTLAWPNGTRIEGDSGALRFIVCNAGKVASAFVVDASGIKVSLADPFGVPSITWSMDGATGNMLAVSKGLFSMKFPSGFLGAFATPATGVGYGVGSTSAQSTTWYVQV